MDIRPDGFRWGTLEREICLIVKVPDYTDQEKASALSKDNKIKKTDVDRLKDSTPKNLDGSGNWAHPTIVRHRSQKFDFTQLSFGAQVIINQEKIKNPSNRRLYTLGLSQNTMLFVKSVTNKPDISGVGSIEADEQFISDVEVEAERRK